jgi:hypothetical protein
MRWPTHPLSFCFSAARNAGIQNFQTATARAAEKQKMKT